MLTAGRRSGAAPAARDARPALLLVEDEASVAATLAPILEEHGYRVVTATTVAEALALIAADPFDAAVFDLQVGDEDGVRALAALREASPAAAAVVLTGYGSLESASRAMALGAHAYLLKPCDVGELTGALDAARDRARRTAGEARRDAENLRAVVDACPLPVIVFAADGAVRLWNPAAARVFGWSADEVLGRPLPAGSDALEMEFRSHLARPVQTGETVDGVETRRLTKQGLIDVRLWGVPLRGAGEEPQYLAIVEDVSERKRAAEAERVLAMAGAVLSSSLEYEETVQRVADLVVPRLATWCTVDVRDDDGAIRRVAVSHPDPDLRARLGSLYDETPLDPNGPHPVAAVLRTARSGLTSDLSEEVLARTARDEPHLSLLRALGGRSGLAVPLVSRGETIGVLSVATTDAERRYDAHDVALFEELGRRCGAAIGDARLYAAEQAARRAAERAADRMARVQAASEALAGVLDSAEAARVIDDTCVAALGASYGVVSLLVEDGSAFEVVHAAGYPPGAVNRWWRTPADAPLPTCDAVAARDVLFVGSREELVARYPRLGDSSILSNAWAFAPLLAGGRALGCISLAFASRPAFGAEERALLSTLASQCAQALERARLHEGLRRAEQQQRLISVASRLFAEARLDESAVFAALGRSLAGTVGDTCMIKLLSDDGSTLVPVAIEDPDPARVELRRAILAEHPIRLGEGVTGRVVATGERVLVPVADYEAFFAALKPEHRPHAERLFFHSLAVVPLRGGSGILGTLAVERLTPGRPLTSQDADVLQEIADRAGLAVENARLYERARAAVRLRDDFLGVAAHELRTPITTVRGTVQLLRRRYAAGQPTPEQVDPALARVEAETGRLGVLVERLLDVSRIERGKLAVELEETNLSALAEDVASRLRDRYGDHPLVVHATAPVVCAADPLRLEQVLTNLIDNAAKFSPRGSPIELEVQPTTDGGRIAVRDRGQGIPPEIRGRVFERFFQADTNRHYGGLGLGLYVSREIVQLHGGRIAVESPADGGTRFVVNLPRQGGVGG